MLPTARWPQACLGTIIGLVQVPHHLDDPSLIGLAMAVALLTLLYGVLPGLSGNGLGFIPALSLRFVPVVLLCSWLLAGMPLLIIFTRNPLRVEIEVARVRADAQPLWCRHAAW